MKEKKLRINDEINAIINDKVVEFRYHDEKFEVAHSKIKSLGKKLIDVPALKKINWKTIKNGTPFTAIVGRVPATGKIQRGILNDEKHKSLFLCQNVRDGSNCQDKLGFDYSWAIRKGTDSNLTEENINTIIISFTETPKKQLKKWNSKDFGRMFGYDVHIYANEIKIGCQKISNEQIEKLIKMLP